MVLPIPLQLLGNVGSPYTRKMIALLRYRRIPHTPIWQNPWDRENSCNVLVKSGIEAPKPMLLPTLLLPDESGKLRAVCDSTPIIRVLEKKVQERRVVPPDPVMAFIDYLLEDFGDEWCTKYMFHYRWHHHEDAENAGTLLPLGIDVTLAEDALRIRKEFIRVRQVERLWVVGSNETTAPIIDASFKRFLKAMDTHLENVPFMLGARPCSADFAIYGQLTQLVGFDPTPRKIANKISPRTVAWTSLMEDQSGLDVEENDWSQFNQATKTLRGLLDEVGRVYIPALLANSAAISRGEKNWEEEIDGAHWTQPVFNYQAKCLSWIRGEYAKLSPGDKGLVDNLIAGTGCEAMF